MWVHSVLVLEAPLENIPSKCSSVDQKTETWKDEVYQH